MNLKNKIMNLDSERKTISMLIYGGSGVGKTILSATASKLEGNTILLSSENGLVGAGNKEFKNDIDLKKITAYQVENFIDYNDYYEFLTLHSGLVVKYDVATGEAKEKIADEIWKLENGDKRPKGQEPRIYRTVIIDSLTESQKRSLDRIIDVRNKKKSSGSLTDDVDFSTATATLQDYGVNTQQMRKLIRAFRDLPMNVIMIALETELKDEVSGEVKVSPALTTKLAADVATYVDVIGRLYTQKAKDGKVDRKLLLQPTGKYIAKDRTGTLGIGMNNPTMLKIAEKLAEGGINI